MTDILTLHLPVPVPAIKTISRWRVFLALFDRGTHFTTCTELQHQLWSETETLARFHANRPVRSLPEEFRV
jgi:hypothetical protein